MGDIEDPSDQLYERYLDEQLERELYEAELLLQEQFAMAEEEAMLTEQQRLEEETRLYWTEFRYRIFGQSVYGQETAPIPRSKPTIRVVMEAGDYEDFRVAVTDLEDTVLAFDTASSLTAARLRAGEMAGRLLQDLNLIS